MQYKDSKETGPTLKLDFDDKLHTTLEFKPRGPAIVRIKSDFGATVVCIEKNIVTTYAVEAHDGIIKNGSNKITLISQADEFTRESRWEAY